MCAPVKCHSILDLNRCSTAYFSRSISIFAIPPSMNCGQTTGCNFQSASKVMPIHGCTVGAIMVANMHNDVIRPIKVADFHLSSSLLKTRFYECEMFESATYRYPWFS